MLATKYPQRGQQVNRRNEPKAFRSVYSMLSRLGFTHRVTTVPLPKEQSMSNNVKREARKAWNRPALLRMEAGSAENTSSGASNDGATTGPKKS